MRGPGAGRGGRSIPRRDKPCPEPLAEFYFCERFGFRILPGDLVPGSVDEQPADSFLFWSGLLSHEASEREYLMHRQQQKSAPGKTPRRR